MGAWKAKKDSPRKKCLIHARAATQPCGRASQDAGAASAKTLMQTGWGAVHGQRGDPCGWSPGREGLW